MTNARPQDSETSARVTVGTVSKFSGTDNPRHLRAIAALLRRPMPRESLDKEVGCSNSPDLIAELRRRGLEVPCDRIEAIDRDGRPCKPGVYHLTGKDRMKVSRWLAIRNRGGIDFNLAALLALSGICALLLLGGM